MYELKGNERVEKQHEKVPCGHCTITRYLHAESGDVLREDVEISVDQQSMKGTAKL
jgi:hypothetical protein